MNYKPSPTAERFHESTAFMRTLEGPIGGGSTTICMQEIIRQCKEMPLNSQGKRRSRWMILSPSFHHRRDCAVRTFDSLACEGIYHSFTSEHIRICHFGQSDVTAEIIFRTSDEPQKYNNMEFTGVFICDLLSHQNSEMALNSVVCRVGRFPAMRDVQEYQYGIIADRAYQQVEDAFDERGEIHMMPPALSVGAENTENLPGGYYHNLLLGKSHEWACRHLLGYPMKIKAEVKR